MTFFRDRAAVAWLPLCAAALLACASAQAQVDGRTRGQLLRKPYQSITTGLQREYFLYLPVGYDTEKGKKWPVILFLHGGGERGDGLKDLEVLLKHGPLMEAWVKGRDLPFIMISPQMPAFPRPAPTAEETAKRRAEAAKRPAPPAAPSSAAPMARVTTGEAPRWGEQGPPNGWWTCEKDLLNMVDSTLRDYRADPARVYLTGLSYGGFGTWYMGMTYPERWAAIAPICGAGNVKTVHRLVETNMPVWVFQGGRDTTVKPEWTLATANALALAGSKTLRMTVHEDMGHDVWTRVYEGWDLYNWFLSHRRD